MKIKILTVLLSLLLLTSCDMSKENQYELDIDYVQKVFEDAAPSDFGYCDVSDFYREAFLDRLDGVKECRIFKCNESTNFNEFGIFEFINAEKARKAEAYVKNYISESKREFENGIIYNVNEYPKFQNAEIKRFDNFIVYGILDSASRERAFNKLKSSKK